MKRTQFNIVGLSLIIGLFLSCGGNKPKTDDPYYEVARHFAADESFSPILDEELDIFNMRNTQDSLLPVYTNEVDAMEMLMKEETWLVFTTRKFTEKEKASLQARTYRPQEIPLAYDGLALIVNRANQDTCITVRDFVRILSGEATKWSDIYPTSRLGTIDVAFDNPKSSTVRYCVDSVLHGKEMVTSGNVGALKTSAEVINYVERHENAIGIIGSNWLNDKRDSTNATFKKEITVMKVSSADVATPRNSYRPYQYHIAYANYPLIRTIYALVNDPRPRGVPRSFASFCWHPDGQLIFYHAGMLPAHSDFTVREVNVRKEH